MGRYVSSCLPREERGTGDSERLLFRSAAAAAAAPITAAPLLLPWQHDDERRALETQDWGAEERKATKIPCRPGRRLSLVVYSLSSYIASARMKRLQPPALPGMQSLCDPSGFFFFFTGLSFCGFSALHCPGTTRLCCYLYLCCCWYFPGPEEDKKSPCHTTLRNLLPFPVPRKNPKPGASRRTLTPLSSTRTVLSRQVRLCRQPAARSPSSGCISPVRLVGSPVFAIECSLQASIQSILYFVVPAGRVAASSPSICRCPYVDALHSRWSWSWSAGSGDTAHRDIVQTRKGGWVLSLSLWRPRAREPRLTYWLILDIRACLMLVTFAEEPRVKFVSLARCLTSRLAQSLLTLRFPSV